MAGRAVETSRQGNRERNRLETGFRRGTGSSTPLLEQQKAGSSVADAVKQELASDGLGDVPLGPKRSAREQVKLGGIDPTLAVSEAELQAYRSQNQALVAKYPALEKVLGDPDAFFADMKSRFEAQKLATPGDPYSFEFGDHGVPVMKGLVEAVDAEISKVEGLRKRFEAGTVLRPGRAKRLAECDTGLTLLRELRAELESRVQQQSVSYRRLTELSYFASRALGYFDQRDLSIRDRVMLGIDRYLQGYQKVSIDEELRRYRQNDYTVFQAPSPVGGFAAAHEPYEKALGNPDEMEAVVMPSLEHLGPQPFIRLVPYNVFINGISAEPSAADGFNRPGGDFYLHDVRHNSAIFAKRVEYLKEHGLNDTQARKLAKMTDRWKSELDEAKKAIADRDVRVAIGFLMFNTHHDRGIPMVPSSYVARNDAKAVPWLLYLALNVSGQGAPFKNPFKAIPKAQAWLKEFWSKRLDEEKALWAAPAAEVEWDDYGWSEAPAVKPTSETDGGAAASP